MITIRYRKKKYEDNNTITSHYALYSNKDIILLLLRENTSNKEVISSVYHNVKNKKEYTDNINKIMNNENYMVTKHEYNRLFKEFKSQFTNNCFL